MITQAESGLDSPTYTEFIGNTNESILFEVTAHKWNLSWSQIRDTLAGAGIDFDAIIHNTRLVRATGDSLEVYDGTTWNTYSYTPPAGATAYMALASNGTTLTVFRNSATGIQYATSADNGQTLSGWTLIASTANSTHIAAVSPTEVHFFVTDGATRTHRLCCVVFSGSWSLKQSDIYLMHRPQSLAAAATSNGTVIVLVMDTPGARSARSVGTQIIKYVYRSGGVVAFQYKDNLWSDHYDVDVLESVTSFRYRQSVTLNVIDNKLYAVCTASSGTLEFPTENVRVFTSKDGQYWSVGEIMPNVAFGPYKILRLGNYAYFVGKSKVYRADSTLYVGLSAPASQITIFNANILEYECSWGETRQFVLIVDNGAGQFDGTFLSTPTNVVALIHKWGFWLPGDTTPTLIQVAVDEIDSVEFAENLNPEGGYDKNIRITSRDRMSWLSDKSQSEQARYWQSQEIGGDNFSDTSGTGWGGLSHTISETGAWKTEQDTLALYTNNAESIAFSSFDTSLWNGHSEITFSLSQLANNEYAGIIFRAVDKDNFWAAFYDQATDVILLMERRAGITFQAGNSAALSWSGDLLDHHLRVEFSYGLIRVMSSNDRITWTTRLTYIQTGAEDASVENENDITALPFERGFVGVIAKGQAPEESWLDEPLPIDLGEPIDIDTGLSFGEFGPAPIDPYPAYTPTTPPYTLPPGQTAIPRDGNTALTISRAAIKVRLTTNLLAGSPASHIDITPAGFDEIYMAIFDPAVTAVGSKTGAYVLGRVGSGVKTAHTDDVFANTITWNVGDQVGGLYKKLIGYRDNAGDIYIYGSDIFSGTSRLNDHDTQEQTDGWWVFEGGTGIGNFSDGVYNRAALGVTNIDTGDNSILSIRYQVPNAPNTVTRITFVIGSDQGGAWDINVRFISLDSGLGVIETIYDEVHEDVPDIAGNPQANFRAVDSGALLAQGAHWIRMECAIPAPIVWRGVWIDKMKLYFGNAETEAKAAYSANYGDTFTQVLPVGPSCPVGGFDGVGRGVTAVGGAASRIARSTALGGAFSKILATGDAYAKAILTTWYKVGSVSATNYGTKPDCIIGLNKVVNGFAFFKMVNDQLYGFKLGNGVASGPNSMTSWKGKQFAVITEEGGTKKVYTTNNTFSTSTFRRTVTGNYIRVRRFSNDGRQLFIANGSGGILYSNDYGATWVTKTYPDASCDGIEPYG